jgi:hypothetical protein
MEKGCVVYCIVGNLGTLSPPGLVGVDGQPVFLISHNGLTAVVSRINRMNDAPSISQLLAYKEVVESLHRSPAVHSIIPMRYGCIADDEERILRLLEKHHPDYTALLKELEGCVEMGIRVLSAECGMRVAECGSYKSGTPHSALRTPHSQTPGRAYLAARKASYAQEEKLNKQVEQCIERCRSAFEGLFKKSKAEVPSIVNRQSSIVNRFPSMYFLLPGASVDAFRKAFRQLSKNETALFLLSGPWPPYNFVQPENAEGV